jgi:hypothetical protein
MERSSYGDPRHRVSARHDPRGALVSDPPRPPGRSFVSGEHRIAGHGDVVGGIAILEDATGTVAMGLVAENVAYVCLVGVISENLGMWCARRLGRLLDRGCEAVFLDAHAVEGGSDAARRTIFYALFFHSPFIPRVACLVPAAVALVTPRLATALRRFNPVVTAVPTEFDELLVDAAPQAHATITINNCQRVRPSTKPSLRVVRSA